MSNIEQIRNRIRNHYEEQKKERISNSKRYQTKWQKYYQSNSWKLLRESKINANPLCENCMKYDIVTSADEVHHIKPFGTGKTQTERWNLLLDYSNLISLCKDCHLEFHRQLKTHNEVYSVVPPKIQYEAYK